MAVSCCFTLFVVVLVLADIFHNQLWQLLLPRHKSIVHTACLLLTRRFYSFLLNTHGHIHNTSFGDLSKGILPTPCYISL